ncbi:unnamed protein product [Thlaspi arvense]|uniref:Neprosin PEP catalytic domain-containing protein n=1 Tax=Thlaspi arvense TaxID=13288 RepID=A0AAU9RH89_THLAR|nr:unnamed protein product [Thlaspi arvense]
MAKENQEVRVSCYMIILMVVAIINVASNGHVEGRVVMDQNYPIVSKPKGTIKTIESEDGREVIDCVDIYKQPAFDHPLINDLQMEPSSYPSGMKMDETQPELIQDWHKNGECPDGTVPIGRTKKYDPHRHFPFGSHRRNFNISSDADNAHEYAIVFEEGGIYRGAQARITVWSPNVEESEMSISQIWIVANPGTDNLNSVEAGWIVLPQKYGDHSQDFLRIGRKKFAVGRPVSPVSIYNETSYEIQLKIFQDLSTKNWMLYYHDELVGYWPGTIFTTLADNATVLEWGGEILNTARDGHHTTTQMGSGHFPNEEIKPNKQTSYGTYFYYGGPGYSAQCP